MFRYRAESLHIHRIQRHIAVMREPIVITEAFILQEVLQETEAALAHIILPIRITTEKRLIIAVQTRTAAIHRVSASPVSAAGHRPAAG